MWQGFYRFAHKTKFKLNHHSCVVCLPFEPRCEVYLLLAFSANLMNRGKTIICTKLN